MENQNNQKEKQLMSQNNDGSGTVENTLTGEDSALQQHNDPTEIPVVLEESLKSNENDGKQDAPAEITVEISEESESENTTPEPVPELSFYNKLQNFFGIRKKGTLNNSSVLLKRMQCNLGYTKHRLSFMVMDVDKTEVYAEIPRIPLYKVWRIAQSEEAQNLLAERAACKKKGKKRGYGLNNADFPLDHGYTEQTWVKDVRQISAFLKTSNAKLEPDSPVLISDVWEMSDLDYQTVFLDHATRFVKILQLVILTDARQNARLAKQWKRIRKYLYRVQLEKSKGGIFSDQDAAILRENGIHYLNDIRKKNIFELKNMFLDHDFMNIVQELNEAFKEDLARRRDRRYKVRPYIAGFSGVTATAVIAFIFRYTLIKNDLMTYIILGLLGICALTVPVIAIGAIRAVYRRRTKRKDYYYFTKPVVRTCKLYASSAVFVLLLLALFYGRYDGYDHAFYYRDLDDGTIAIAGLVNNQRAAIDVPETIDDKVVSEIDLCAFYRDNFASVKLPSSLRLIDRAAFLHCNKLESVTFNDGLVQIEKNAFRDCRVLKEMAFPASLTEVGTQAFAGSGISSISLIGTGLTELQTGVFKDCQQLEIVEGLTQITKIGSDAFNGCTLLSQVQLSDELTEIGARAFCNCETLQSLTVPKSVQMIGVNAFMECTGLLNVSLPYLGMTKEDSYQQSLKNIMPMSSKDNLVDLIVTDSSIIGSKAFKGIDWINSVTLEETVTEISNGAFKNMVKLKEVSMSPSVMQIGNNVFEGCTSLQSVSNTAQITLISNKAFKNCQSLADVDMASVKTIGKEAFYGCVAMKTFRGFDSVVDIQDKAFGNCTSLETAVFGSSLNSIGKQAFDGCSSMKSLFIPDNVSMLGKKAFANTNLEDLTIPYFGSTKDKSASQALSTVFDVANKYQTMTLTVVGVDTISRVNLENCTAIKSLILGDTVQNIEKGAFSGLPLQNVVFSDSVTSIPESAFQNCTELSEVNSANSIVTIGNYAFSGCSKLTSMPIESVKHIGVRAFENCSELWIPGDWMSIETIGEYAFAGAMNVNQITITSPMVYLSDRAFADSSVVTIILPDGMREIGEGCFDNSAVSNIQLPKDLTVIHEYAFRNCTQLRTLTFPESLTEIRGEAFHSSGLRRAELSETQVALIGAYAFAECHTLESLSLPKSLKVIPEGMVMNSENCILQNAQSVSVVEVGAYAFKNAACSNEKLSFEDGLTGIGTEAFCNTNVIELVLPNSLSGIGENAFASCDSLQSATLPFIGSAVNKVGNGAAWVFGNSSAVSTLVLTNMKKVEDDTFAACQYSVENISLNDGISKLPSGYFKDFTNLAYVRLPESLTEIENSLFENCHELKSVTIPKNVQTIRARAFAGCDSLESVHMENTAVNKIEREAFMNCNRLTTVQFSESLVTVRENAFAGCTSLENVTFTKNMTKVHDDAFGGVTPKNLVIPEELAEKYKGKFGLAE